jgi:hypothetical protein
MSASTRTAPAQLSFGRFPSALAALALVVILAVAVAIVALNGTKAAATVTTGAKGAPPPAVIDHGWSNGETVILPKTISHFGGWAGPRAAPVVISPVGNDGPKSIDRAINGTLKGPVVLGGPASNGTGGGHNGARRAQ